MSEQAKNYHEPVLLKESVDCLLWRESGTFVDGTLGGGGHAEAILRKLSADSRLIGIDRDDDAIQFASKRLAQFHDQFIAVNSNFREITKILGELDLSAIDGILLDLGVSSYQIDAPERGFTYQATSRLDMRMSQSIGLTAAQVLNTYSETDLANVIYRYGEERFSRKIARQIVAERKQKAFEYSDDLKQIIEKILPYSQQIKSLSRVFQALRIEVNQELISLEQCLKDVISVLNPGGRIVIISYHSLEDRIVKQFFRQEAEECKCPPQFPRCVCGARRRLNIITRKPIVPVSTEIEVNSRARSARLRVAERIV